MSRIYDTFATRLRADEKQYQYPNPPIKQFTGWTATTLARQRASTTSASPETDDAGRGNKTATYHILDAHKVDRNDQYCAIAARAHSPEQFEANTRMLVPNGNTPGSNGSESSTSQSAQKQQIFSGLHIYLASSLGLSPALAHSVLKTLKKYGAADCYYAGPLPRESQESPESVDIAAQRQQMTGMSRSPSLEEENEWAKVATKADYVIINKRSGWEYWMVCPMCWLVQQYLTPNLGHGPEETDWNICLAAIRHTARTFGGSSHPSAALSVPGLPN